MAAPVVILAYGLLALATGLAYLFMIGSLAFALGFGVVGIIKIARKKWLPGVVCLLMCIAFALYAYGYITGGT